MVYDTIIIGGGVAGLGAAIYTSRFELKTLVLTENIGGTIVNTNEIANYPGFSMIGGLELTEKFQKQAEEYHTEIITSKVEKIEKKDNFIVRTKDSEYESKTIIFATGTEWRKLRVPGEQEFKGKGVHYCALCDGAFYKDKVCAVIGGGDSAIKDAVLLTKYASKVYIIVRKDRLRAEPITIKNAESSDKVEMIMQTNVKEIKGSKFVDSLVLDKAYHGSRELKVDGVFVDIGHIPLSGLAKELGVKTDERDEIVIDRHGYTNVEGVFAAGDVTDTKFKQAITGVGEGVTAAYNVYNYLNSEKEIDRMD